MGLEEIIPSVALILVLILVLPGFINSNLKRKVFFKNLSISSVQFGTVKSIITSVFLKVISEFNSGLTPLNFLFINLFSVSVTSLKFLFFFED